LDQMNRMEDMLATLITMQGTNNAKLEELTGRVDHLTGRVDQMAEELTEVKDTLHTFRSETSIELRKIDRHIKLIDIDLDNIIDRVNAMSSQPT
jgi:outer membrane murein-binding lipoprotein Lpp